MAEDAVTSRRARGGDSRAALTILFAGVFALHALFFFSMRHVYPEWEPAEIPRNGWLTIAQNVVAGHGYVTPALLTYFPAGDLVPTAARGPVPVYFLAAFVTVFPDPYYPLLVASWLFSAGNALLIYVTVRRMAGSPRLALVSAFLSGAHLSEMYINTTFSHASEPIFMHLVGWSVLCSVIAIERRSWRYAAITGLCLGVTCLARSAVVLLPAVLAVVFVAAHRAAGIRLAIAAACAFALVQLPWVVRNYTVFGRPVLTTTLNGYGLYMSGIAARDGRVGLRGWRIDRNQARTEMESVVAASEESLEFADEPALDDVLGAAGRGLIAAHFQTYVKNAALGMVGIWYWVNSGRGLYLLQNAVYDLLALAGLCVALARRQRALLALLLLPAYAVLVHTPFLPQYRYLLPFTPYVFVFSAVGGLWLVDRLRPRAQPPSAAHA